MERVQKIQKAKSYLEMLANQINPVTQDACDDQILKYEQIKNCFLYVSNILSEIIQNDGEVINVSSPVDFNQNIINKDKIKISKTPIGLKSIAFNINRQIDKKSMKTLKESSIKNWLINTGYLTEEKIQVVRNVKEIRLTEKSNSIGIIEEGSLNKKTGELKQRIKLTEDAQKFIIDNLENIVLADDNDEISNEDEILL